MNSTISRCRPTICNDTIHQHHPPSSGGQEIHRIATCYSKGYMCSIACIVVRSESFNHHSSKLDGALAAIVVDVFQLKLLISSEKSTNVFLSSNLW